MVKLQCGHSFKKADLVSEWKEKFGISYRKNSPQSLIIAKEDGRKLFKLAEVFIAPHCLECNRITSLQDLITIFHVYA